MSCRCELTGIKVQYGNNVSHSQRKTRRSFKPNVRMVSCISDLTGQKYNLKIVAKTLRTIDKVGGFDAFMLKADEKFMSLNARKIRSKIVKKSRELA